MSKIEHPNAFLFEKKDFNEIRKFERRNDPASKSRAKRIKHEEKLINKYLERSVKVENRVRAPDGLCKYAMDLGFASTYFAAMRSTNKKKYEKLLSFDSDAFTSIAKYVQYVESIVIGMEEVLNATNAKKYNEVLIKSGIINNINPIQNFERENLAVFKIRESDADFISILYPSILKWERVIKAYRELRQ